MAWVINSPSLIQQQVGWPTIIDPSHSLQDNWVEQWLISLDSNPDALQAHLSQEKSHFIGTYFESLWAFYLMSNPRYELIAKNLQANSKGRTEGEFDFIVFDNNSDEYIHQEIAIKFYLGFSQQNEHSFSDGKHIWLGPQCKDRLDLKMDKMLNSQIHLSNKDSGKQALKSINIDPVSNHIKTQLIMKGYLFYPTTPSVVAPDICNQNHLRGLWFTLEEFETHIKKSKYDAWAILTKPEWVSPYRENANITKAGCENSFTNKTDVIHAVRQKVITEDRPWMVACLTKRENDYLETQRFFVVPDDWPKIDK